MSDPGSTDYTFQWYNDFLVCGNTSYRYPSLAGEVSNDFSHLDGSVRGTLTVSNRAAIVPATYIHRITIEIEIFYINHTDAVITHTFVVKEHDCRPQNTSPTFNALEANAIQAWPLVHTDFQAHGIDETMCLGTETFELSGPASGNSFMLISDATISDWVSSAGNVLTITVTNPSAVDFDGRYAIRYINGKSEETTEVVICFIT